MHHYLLQETAIHADETTMQVLAEEGRPATSKSYMWLYATGIYSPQIFLSWLNIKSEPFCQIDSL